MFTTKRASILIFCLILAFALLFALCSCNKGNDSNDSNTSTDTSSNTDTSTDTSSNTDTSTDTDTSVEGTEGLDYTISDDESYYIVSGIGTYAEKEIIIPSTYQGLPVKKIGNSAFKDRSFITNITIPSSVTSIGSYAFSGCPIENATIPTIAISYIPKTKLKTVVINGGDTIKDSAFEDCTSLTSVTIPDSVTSIGEDAFRACTRLTSITIPNSVTSIGGFAFYGCSLLKYNEHDNAYYLGNDTNPYVALVKAKGTDFAFCDINESTRFIFDEAFDGCSLLTSVTIPDSVTSIGYYAFRGCTGLTSVNYLGEVEQWCNISFGDYDANPLSYAKKLYINNELVTDLVIPNTVTKIKPYAFYNCTSLTSVTIPDSVTTIGYYAFQNCTGLTSVTIGDSVTTIGGYAFYNCTSLTSITIPNSVTSIGSYAFKGCSLLKYNEYDNAYYLGNDTNPYVALVKAKSTDITSCVINKSTRFIYDKAFDGCSLLTSITIPDSVTTIGRYAFFGCTGLTSVKIGNSVTTIGYEAFQSCTGLTSIIIPDSVTTIESNAFAGCTSLTSVTIPNSVTTIEEWAFTGCTGLTSVNISNIANWCNITFCSPHATPLYNGAKLYINNELVTSLVIPDTVTEIKSWAFFGCTGLTSVTIPDSVTTIEYEAFQSCTGLTIYCEVNSKPSGWNSNWNGSDCPVYWYSESEPSTDGSYWHYGENGEIVIWE